MRNLNNISIEANLSPEINLLPLIGETAWHSITIDPSIVDVSRSHYDQLISDLKMCGVLREGLRVLEVGAYAHITGYILAQSHKTDVTLFDISAATLRMGRNLAQESGIYNAQVRLVAGDFHALPFDNSEFDVVYIASALHHTWRWRKVLSELIRVMKVGGYLILENEPCRRELCFYRFRTNRQDDLTAEETFLDQHGLLRTVAEPYLGSRPEQLFGMTENQEMRLADVIGEISLSSEVVLLQASPEICMGRLENTLDSALSTGVNDARSSVVARLIREAFDNARLEIKKSSKLDQKIMPEVAHVDALIARIISLIGNSLYGRGAIMLAASGSNNPVSKESLTLVVNSLVKSNPSLGKALDRATLFGAAIKLIVRKQRELNDARSARIESTIDDGVHMMFESDVFQIIDPRNTLFPQMQRASIEDIAQAFGPDWSITIQHNFVRVATPLVVCPIILTKAFQAENVVISARVFGIVGERAWTLWLLVDGERRSCLVFEKSGSGLLVASVANAVGPLRIEFETVSDNGHEIPKFNISHLGLLKIPSY